MRQRLLGFSLIELMVALGIFAVLATLSISNLGQARHKAKAQGMADVLAEELRAARRRAMSKGYPVAVVFPSDNGSTPCARSFYILEGREKAEFHRSKTLGNESAEAFIFSGTWNGSETVGDPPTSDVADNFDPSSWLPANLDDRALIFMPTGRVRSHGLGLFDSNYHLLSALDVEYAGVTATSAAEPYTITITPLGEVSVKAGADSLATSTVNTLPSIAQAVSDPASGNSAPVISDVALLPKNNDVIYGGDVYSATESFAQLYPEEGNADGMMDFSPLSINLSATDPDGDQLFFRLSSSPDEGSFSVPGDADGWAPMDWDPDASLWRANASWLAPATAVMGDSWTIEAEISDGTMTVSSSGSFSKRVQRARGLGKIAFDKRLYNDASGDWNDAVYAMHLDGTGITKITDIVGVNENNPTWSPEGAYLAFSSTIDGDLDKSDIWISTADGRYRYNLTHSPGVDEQFPVFSPDGNRVAYLKDGNGDGFYGIYIKNVREGSFAQAVVYDASSSQYPASWDPTGEYLCYQQEEPDGTSLVIQKPLISAPRYRRIDASDPGKEGSLTDSLGLRWDVQGVEWCPKNRLGHGMILIRADRDGDGKCGLYLLAVNPVDPLDETSDPIYLSDTDVNPPIQLLPESQDVTSCSWARGANKIAVACEPDSSGKYKVKVLFLNYDSWPPTVSSSEEFFSGQDNFMPRFTSNGNMIVVQSTPDKDTPYSLYRINIVKSALELLTTESKDVISHSSSR